MRFGQKQFFNGMMSIRRVRLRLKTYGWEWIWTIELLLLRINKSHCSHLIESNMHEVFGDLQKNVTTAQP